MITVIHANIYKIGDYSRHLKSLSDEDKISRFGYKITDYNIDQLILTMCYNPKNHELWYVKLDDVRVGWGHMAKNSDGSWELAVSVESNYQRRGIGSALIAQMLTWAKFHHVSEVFMHCIYENKVIQHLATKHELEIRERGHGERTAAIEVPEPNFFEVNSQLLKEQAEIIGEITKLRGKLASLWLNQVHQKG